MASRSPAHPRPLSPHLQIYRWGPHMLVSILHRACGVAMATAGAAIFTWWLAALAAGPVSYGRFHRVFFEWAGGALGYLFAIGLSLVFFIHMANGIRHLVMDTGANFELKGNKRSALAVMIGGLLLTAIYWLYILVLR